jgi:hypothetical protein
MEEDNLMQKTILFELQGKNQAVHEYDKMLWNLRIGFLTVFFAIWGLLIKTIIEKGSILEGDEVFSMMNIMAYVITGGALLVDLNYSWRKYKVIKALNDMYQTTIDICKKSFPFAESFRKMLLISGTSRVPDTVKGDFKSMIHTGLGWEVIVCLIIYIFPMAMLLFGLSMFPK